MVISYECFISTSRVILSVVLPGEWCKTRSILHSEDIHLSNHLRETGPLCTWVAAAECVHIVQHTIP